MKGLIPGSKIKGVDICGIRYNCFIIRADLGCYLKTTDLKDASNLTLHDLHHSCVGDHYVGHINDSFYIIKGNSYRRVKNLSTDSGCKECKDIHPNYHDADYYFSAMGKFYIIFKDENIYKTTSNLTSPDCQEHPLSDDYSDGLYYWGRSFHFYIMSVNSNWGAEYIKGSNLSSGNKQNFFSVHKDILHFLPGGLSLIEGPAFGKWEKIKHIENDRDTVMTYENTITKKVGYNKEKVTEITHKWNMKFESTIKPQTLAALLVKAQLSFSAEYGGSHVSTEKENWNEEIEEAELIKLELQPYTELYMWQYRLGLGNCTMLSCRNLKVTNDSEPPTEIPLPCAEE